MNQINYTWLNELKVNDEVVIVDPTTSHIEISKVSSINTELNFIQLENGRRFSLDSGNEIVNGFSYNFILPNLDPLAPTPFNPGPVSPDAEPLIPPVDEE